MTFNRKEYMKNYIRNWREKNPEKTLSYLEKSREKRIAYQREYDAKKRAARLAKKGKSEVMLRQKYGNTKTVVDGITLDSKREAKRWRELNMMLRAGVIQDLKRQVRFEFHINGKPVKMRNGQCARYTADFTYTENGKQIAEDVKGVVTEAYALRRAFMKAIFGIEIREV